MTRARGCKMRFNKYEKVLVGCKIRFNKYEKVLVAARGHPIFPDYNPTTAGKYGKTEASLNYPFLKFKDGSKRIVPPREAKGLVRD